MTDRIALITGASRGMGRSMARHLAARGVAVIGTYHSDREAADAAVAEIEAEGGKASMLQLDVADSASFADFTSRLDALLAERFEGSSLNFVVHNAGTGVLGPYEQTSEADLDALYRLHFKGPFLLSQQLLERIAPGGRILNVSSAATRFALADHCAYAGMKSALEVTTMYMAKELGERDIRVNCVAPGAVETDFAGGAVRDDPDVNAHFSEITPLGRPGRPDDIGAAVASLLSSDFNWLNGQRIELTGGQSL